MGNIKLNLNFYDNKQKKLFEAYSNFPEIEKLVSSPIFIDESEFLAHFLFTEQKDKDGFRTYDELREKVGDRISYIRDYVNMDHGTINCHEFSSEQNYKDIVERLGVAGSLSVMNKLHNLTEADWTRIPIDSAPKEKRIKTMDFEIASDGNKYVIVESKGSIAEDNQKKTSSVSQHKHHIIEKKQALPKSNRENLCYGVITVMDTKQTLQSWLIDPNSPFIEIDPQKYRLLARLYFYWENLRIVGFNDRLLLILINRIKIIEAAGRNYLDFNEIPFLNGQGNELQIQSHGITPGRNAKIEDEDFPVVGRGFFLDGRTLVFLGFLESVGNLILSQDFEQLLKPNFKSKQDEKVLTVRIEIDNEELVNMVKQAVFADFIRTEEYIMVKMKGKFYYTNTGRVFGIIDF